MHRSKRQHRYDNLTKDMTDKSKYTHYARVLYIPAYFNIETNEIVGRNWMYDFLINYVAFPIQASCIWVLSLLDPSYEPMWMIEIGDEIN